MLPTRRCSLRSYIIQIEGTPFPLPSLKNTHACKTLVSAGRIASSVKLNRNARSTSHGVLVRKCERKSVWHQWNHWPPERATACEVPRLWSRCHQDLVTPANGKYGGVEKAGPNQPPRWEYGNLQAVRAKLVASIVLCAVAPPRELNLPRPVSVHLRSVPVHPECPERNRDVRGVEIRPRHP